MIASVPEVNLWKLDREIDFENVNIRGRMIPQHLSRIAACMSDWENLAIHLGLTKADQCAIVGLHKRNQGLQRYISVLHNFINNLFTCVNAWLSCP